MYVALLCWFLLCWIYALINKQIIFDPTCSRKQELEKVEGQKRLEKEQQEVLERQARLNCEKEDEDRRQRIVAKLEEMQKREIRENLKVEPRFT